jgi:hypothetical protein
MKNKITKAISMGQWSMVHKYWVGDKKEPWRMKIWVLE